jgi:protoporphyrinogen oxidase
LSSLIEPIARQPGLELRAGVAAERIEKLSEGYRLWLADGSSITAETIVLAVAPDVAGRLLEAVSPELAQACGGVGMAEFDSLGVMFRAEASGLRPLAGIIAHDDSFYSALSRDTVADSRYRAFTFHFRPGSDPQRHLARACEVLGLEPQEILEHAARRNRLPALRTGHDAQVAALDRHLAAGRLGLIGNWFSGVSIEDSLLRAVAEFERLYPV